jgi:glycosyltransferase involved in cell wall biosynthesis
MNIVVICNSYPTTANPLNQIFIKKIVNQLELRGHDVSVCYNRIFDFWGSANGVKNPFANFLKYVFFFGSVFFFWILRKKRTDLIFSHAIVFPTSAAVVLKLFTGIKVVSYVHGGDLNSYYRKKGVLNRILRVSLDRADHIICNSQDIYEKVLAVSVNPNTSIITPGVDLTVMRELQNLPLIREKHQVALDKPLILLAGNAIKRKGFDIFLDALKLIDKSVLKKLQVVILTDGPEKENLIGLVALYNLNEVVSIRSKVSPEVLNEYNNIADVFVFPSREEPLGLVALEAAAASTIVIGARVGGIKEFLVDNKTGFLFTPESSVDLAAKLSFVLSNLSQLNYMYPYITKMARTHSLTESVDKLEDLFGKLIYNS